MASLELVSKFPIIGLNKGGDTDHEGELESSQARQNGEPSSESLDPAKAGRKGPHSAQFLPASSEGLSLSKMSGVTWVG